MEGNTALGASSPAKPAFTRPEPLSHTRAVVSSSSHMVASVKELGKKSSAHLRRYIVYVTEGPSSLNVWLICLIYKVTPGVFVLNSIKDNIIVIA